MGYSILLYMAGYIYGFPLGFAPAFIGAFSGGCVCFFLTRKFVFLRKLVDKFLRKQYPTFTRIEQVIKKRGFKVKLYEDFF